MPTFYTLDPARFITKNEVIENIANKEAMNKIFPEISRTVRHETDIQNRLIVINAMSLVSCWLLGVGINQAQVPYPESAASDYLALMGSTALFLMSQFFDSLSGQVNEKRTALRQAKIEYNVAVRDAFNRGWVKGGAEVDVIHMINGSMAKAWYLLELHNDLPVDKFYPEDVAIITMNMFKGLCRAMNENKANLLNDNDIDLIAYNWQAYVNSNSCERLNCRKFLCYAARVQTPPVVFFNNMPSADSFFEIADAVLKKAKEEVKVNLDHIKGDNLFATQVYQVQPHHNDEKSKRRVSFLDDVHYDESKVDNHYSSSNSTGKESPTPANDHWSKKVVANEALAVGRLRARSI